jgi:hypothetical protein
MRQSFNIRLPAGKVWPAYESELTGGGRQIKRYNWLRIHNRGTVPLYVDTKGIPNSNDLSEVWDVIMPGQLVVRNLGAFEDPEGWADELHILNPAGAAAAALALVEISDKPIVDIRSSLVFDPTNPGVITGVKILDASGGFAASVLGGVPGDSAALANSLEVAAIIELWNGATADKWRSASAANLAAQSALGAGLVALPGEWPLDNSPAVGAQATASKAAGAAGVRHVCKSVGFVISAGAALAAPTTVVINLRDGATGAGAVLRSWTIDLPAAIIPPFGLEIAGLNIVGSAATVMTIESDAAHAGLRVSVHASGADAV